jgi:adenylylsulfate kinase-like enzyme
LPTWPEGLASLAAALFPGAALERVELLAPDTGAGGDTEKVEGYGKPLKVTVRAPGGSPRAFVFRTHSANEFGHDRRADRAEEALLAYDLFNATPAHVRALDVGFVGSDGRLVSVRAAGEAYLATEWAEGTLYAEDLRRLSRAPAAAAEDLARAEALAAYLGRLHAERSADAVAWRRAVRDLLGHGEGIFGIVDGYPADVPAAPPARLRGIEERCLAWRWRLRGRTDRLARTHGDFHPFNVVVAPGDDPAAFTLLDASRGGRGDPADDAVALSVNYVFFALERPAAWERALGPLWHAFWRRYLEGADPAVLDTAPPFLAWRALVLASPRFYPHLSTPARDALLRLAEETLDAGRLDLDAPGRILSASAAAPESSGPAGGGTVVWVTGLPSSGKSTFARALRDRLAAGGRAAAVLDGDDVRAALSPAPGYDPSSRAAFYETLGNLAVLLAREAIVAIVAATAPRRTFRDRVRARTPRFVEVHVDVPAEVCEARDAKGLWARARAGEAPYLPGAGAAYEPPETPEVIAAGGRDAAAVERVLALVP